MNDTVRPVFHGFEQIPLREYAERAYLDYSMYVVLDRALPFLGDGLKPVQRRIIYAMSELGLNAGAKPKKSARTVGDVIGKYHPHGDSACYEALVLMAQPFSYRYPLIEGQGNFGSTDDPKSFAAMRYTESKLTPIAEVLLGELGQGTVDWDAELRRHAGRADAGCRRACRTCCSTAPPASRSAWPPTCRRTTSTKSSAPACACSTIRTRPSRDLCEHVRGPDYPTTAEIITPRADLLAMYETGLRQRARARHCTSEDGSNIVITALPYQVSPGKVIEQIATQMRAKKLPWLEDIRDESDHANPIAHRAGAALQPRRRRAADGPPVRDHGPGEELPGQPQRDRPGRPPAGEEPEGAAWPSG